MIDSGGTFPVSIATQGDLLYVLNAENGGYNDWTAKGSLASKRLDEALFSLEPGKLSQVIANGTRPASARSSTRTMW